MNLIRPSKIVFVNDKIEKEFLELSENDDIKKHIRKAMDEIKLNAFSGIQLPKGIIPKDYVKRYGAQNLWKYDLPDGWRLIYTITTPNKIEIISVILEWFDHPNYEKKFNY